MSNNDLDYKNEPPSEAPKGHAGIVPAVIAVLLIALGGNWYLLNRSNDLRDQVAQMRIDNQAQLTKLGDATNTLLEQRLAVLNDEVKNAHESSSAAVKQARSEAKKQKAQISRQLADQQKQVADQLAELKDTVSSDVSNVQTDVSSVKSDVALTQSQLEKHDSDLKRVMGDMGVMSGLIATNAKDLQALRDLGDRNYYEFALRKGELTKRIGDVTLTLKKADTKRNRYTMDILADDKHVEKKDKTINEPVQLYVSGGRQPYEIVVNQVKKNEVVGYLATPKVRTSQR
jgi:uncharacterized phage infection (PIP) family protein YhgE